MSLSLCYRSLCILDDWLNWLKCITASLHTPYLRLRLGCIRPTAVDKLAIKAETEKEQTWMPSTYCATCASPGRVGSTASADSTCVRMGSMRLLL